MNLCGETLWPVAAIFEDGVPELLAPALKVISFDSEYQNNI